MGFGNRILTTKDAIFAKGGREINHMKYERYYGLTLLFNAFIVFKTH
jgi:hypothetical protein